MFHCFLTRQKIKTYFETSSFFRVVRMLTLHVDVLETPLPGRTHMSPLRHQIALVTMHATCNDVIFSDSLEFLYAKSQSRVLTVCELAY